MYRANAEVPGVNLALFYEHSLLVAHLHVGGEEVSLWPDSGVYGRNLDSARSRDRDRSAHNGDRPLRCVVGGD